MARDWLPWFQMASTVVAAVGIGISTWIGVSALNGNRKDRREKILPNLLFTPGGETAPIVLRSDCVFPGRDLDDPQIRGFLSELPVNSRKIVLREPVGELGNFGSGPAMNITITFLPSKIATKDGWRPLSAHDQANFAFTRGANEIVPSPAHLAEGKTARLGVLPGAVCFLPADSDAISGRFEIRCTDAHGASVRSLQEIEFAMVSGSGKRRGPSLAISFGDRILDDSRRGGRFARWLSRPVSVLSW